MGHQLLALDHQELGHDSGCLFTNGDPEHECYQAGIFESLPRVANSSLLSCADLATETPAAVTHATVASRLDNCNSVYTSLSLRLSLKLQVIQRPAM